MLERINRTATALDRSGRVHALDEARAIAILALIAAHLAPAALERLPTSALVENAVLIFARFATPAFVAIFGVTAGLVYIRPYRAGEPRRGDRRLLARARLVFLCALLVATPEYAALAQRGEVTPLSFALASYGILMFYAIAVAATPLLLRLATRRPVAGPVGAGIALWALGSALAFGFWPAAAELNWIEIARLYLVSGSYALLPMLGTAAIALPLGVLLRRAVETGRTGGAVGMIGGVGAALLTAGLVGAAATGRLDAAALASGALKAPPRAWYFALFAGASMVMIAAFYALPRMQWMTVLRLPLRLLGQAALPVYVGHVFLRPGAEALRAIGAGPAPLDVLAPLAVFAAFVAFVLMRRAGRIPTTG